MLLFEIVLNATAMFNHGNVRLPASIDRVLRLLVVTPDMHRVHHSVDPRETNSNFGFNVPWWDRLFGTYRAQPQAGHDRDDDRHRAVPPPRELWLDRMLCSRFAPMPAATRSAVRPQQRAQFRDHERDHPLLRTESE